MITITGCARKNISYDEMLALKQATDKERVRVYNATSEEIIRAAGETLTYTDSDYQIAHIYDNGALFKRKWFITFIFSSGFGEDFWKVETEPMGNATKITTTYWPGETYGGLVPLPFGTAGSETNYPYYPNLYKLFYKRLETKIGLNKEWMDCVKAKKVFTGANDRSLEPLCGFADTHQTAKKNKK
jgi:hypothetical protein